MRVDSVSTDAHRPAPTTGWVGHVATTASKTAPSHPCASWPILPTSHSVPSRVHLEEARRSTPYQITYVLHILHPSKYCKPANHTNADAHNQCSVPSSRGAPEPKVPSTLMVSVIRLRSSTNEGDYGPRTLRPRPRQRYSLSMNYLRAAYNPK